MAGRVYLSVDFFVPFLLRPAEPPDEYTHDVAALHVILQPMLLKSAQQSQPDIHELDVRDYLRNWTASTLQGNPPILIGPSIGQRLRDGRVRAVPVTFPPECQVSMAAEWISADGIRSSYDETRTFGGITPAGQPIIAVDQLPTQGAMGWPKSAELSNAIPLIRIYADLDRRTPTGPQKEIVRRWLISLFTKMHEMIEHKRAGDPDPLWLNMEPWKRIWNSDVSPRLPATPLADLDAWEKWLDQVTAGKPRAAHYYEEFIPAYDAILPGSAEGRDPFLSRRPPRFGFYPDDMLNRPDLFSGGLNIAGRSYLHALWSELRSRADIGHPGPLEEALGRLFGFGERLAWPKAKLGGPVSASKNFMVLRPTLMAQYPDWFITNVISLAGQVFRLSPVPLDAPLQSLQVTRLKVQGQDVSPDDTGNPAADRLAAGIRSVQAAAARVPPHRPIEISAEWRADYARAGGTRNERTVLWHTRQADIVRLEPPGVPRPRDPQDKSVTYAVPAVLLDAADASARTVADELGRLPFTQPPRRGLMREEVLDGKKLQLDWQTKFRIVGRLDSYPLGEPGGGAAIPRAYVLRVADELHSTEAVVRAWLGAIVLGNVVRDVQLWVRQKGNEPPKRVVVNSSSISRLAPYPRTLTDGTVLVLDEKENSSDPAGPLTMALADSDEGPAGPQKIRGWTIDIVFSVVAGEPFNLIVDPKGTNPPPQNMQLKRGLITRVAFSADRVTHSIAATWKPGFAPDDAEDYDIQANYGGDSNKLRLSIPGFIARNPPDPSHPALAQSMLSFSDPDALLPLPAKGTGIRPFEVRGLVNKTGPQAWYWLAYHLDQTREVGGLFEEELRFKAWTSAGIAWSLRGYMEHQFGHRLPMAAPTVELRRASDIAHPADVTIRGLLKAEEPAADARTIQAAPEGQVDPVPRRTLLRLQEAPAGSFQITLHRKAVRLAIERYDAPDSDAAQRGRGAEGGRTGALQRIYRSLSDLRDAITTDQAIFTLETYVFDNRALESRPTNVDIGLPERPVAPNILRNLVLKERHSIKVAPPPGSSPLARLFAALGGTLDQFVAVLKALVPPNPTEDKDLEKDSEWTILERKDDSTLTLRAHFVRGSLQMTRPAARVIDQGWGTAAFVPLHDPKVPYDENVETELRQQARAELNAYLLPPSQTPQDQKPSRLWERLAFVERRPKKQSIGIALGEAEQQLLAPEGSFAPVDPVVDLFYVPYAFIVPKAHPALRDRQGTLDFAAWLIALVMALAEGRPLDDMVTLKGPLPVKDAARLKNAAIELIEAEPTPSDPNRNGLALALDALLARVEPDEVTGHSAYQTALFEHVSRLVQRAEALPEHGWRAVRLAMMKRRPTLFGEAKGIALGLFNARHDETPAQFPFNADTFSPQLFSLSLVKHVLRDEDPPDLPDDKRMHEVERFDYTRFHGNVADSSVRFFVDVLPEAVYDDTIQIDANLYKGVDVTNFDALGVPRRRADIALKGGQPQRGGALAQDAEGVIERKEAATGIRNLEANVVHYNPAWRSLVPNPQNGRLDHAEFYYFLPDRRLPPVPRTLAQVNDPKGAPVGRSEIAVKRPGNKPNLGKLWPKEADATFNALSEFHVPAAGEPRVFKRIDTVTDREAPRLRAPACKGWHLITSYLSHHWFEIDLQWPDKSLRANFDDTVFEIEVELWNGQPPVVPSVEPKTPGGSSKLLDWFTARQQQARGETVKLPDPIEDPGKLMQELRSWLLQRDASEPFSGQTLLERPEVARAPDFAMADRISWRKFRITPPFAGKGWKLENPGKEADQKLGDIGSWAGFEIYAPPGPDGKVPDYGAAPAQPHHSALIRFSILDHPFHISRVRMRLVRNWKDVGNDLTGDLRDEFVLTAAYSSWTSYGREPLTVNVQRLRELEVSREYGGAVYVRPQVPRREWLTKWQAGDSSVGKDVAAAFPFSLNAVIDFEDGPATLWEPDYMLSESHLIGATLFQPLEDTMPQYGIDGADVKQDSPRHHRSSGYIFKTEGKDAFLKSLAQLDSRTVGVEPHLEFRWFDKNRIPVMTAVLPLYVEG
ncbi:MAG: hypothetical protein R3D69_00125 [Xanthobacteraceae bacterium]